MIFVWFTCESHLYTLSLKLWINISIFELNLETMNHTITYVLLFTLGLTASCTSSVKEKEISTESEDQKIAVVPHPGENLFKAYCYSCHNGEARQDSRIAPPIFAIQRRYKMEYSEMDAFVSALAEFTLNPSEDNVLMYDAIEKFGLMPPMAYDKSDVLKIAEYIHQADFTHPGNQPANGKGEKLQPKQRGKFVASATKANLGQNLMAAIKSKGTKGAIEFCNIHAISITDSMRNEMGVESIQRVSDKARNPKNTANKEEIGYISTFKTQLENGEDFEVILNDLGETFVYYSPITTNKLCTQCHGAEESIKPEALSRIKELYSEDKATGYSENEVRGMWKIVMAKD